MAASNASTRFRRLTTDEVAAYDLIPAELAARAVLVTVPTLPGPYAGLTLGRFLLLTAPVSPSGTSLLVAHELVHLRQWHELGIVGFAVRYLYDFVRGLRRHRSWPAAYRHIDAEVEARTLAEAWYERRTRPPPGAS